MCNIRNTAICFFILLFATSIQSQVVMDYATGTANVSVPLANLRGESMQFPISINYNTGGIRVDERASAVGLGWSIDGGGAVMRVIHGLPDEQRTDEDGNDIFGGWLQANDAWVSVPSGLNFSVVPIENPRLSNANLENLDISVLSEEERKGISDGTFDTEPDEFYISAPGLSAKFVFGIDDRFTVGEDDGAYGSAYDENGLVRDLDAPVLLTNVDLRIEYTRSLNEIESFIITNSAGYKYYFSKKEKFSSTSTSSNSDVENSIEFVQTWHLERIESPSGEVEAEFIYGSCAGERRWVKSVTEAQTEALFRNGLGDIQEHIVGVSNETESCKYSFRQEEMLVEFSETQTVLTEIKTGLGRIVFNYTLEREDRASRALQSIQVFANEELLEVVDFGYFYFQNSSFGDSDALADTYGKRMGLRSLTWRTPDLVAKNNPLVFHYSSKSLPDFNSNAIDHWGYFNQQDNPSKAPFYEFGIPYLNNVNVNREAGDSEGFNLKRIEYPDGGFEEFEYEQHSISSIRGQDLIEPLITEANLSFDQTIHQGVYDVSQSHVDYTSESAMLSIEEHQVVDMTVSVDFDDYNFPGSEECGAVYRNFIFSVTKDDVLYGRVYFDSNFEQGEMFNPEFNSGQDFTLSKQFALEPGDYTVECKLKAHCKSAYNIEVVATITYASFSDREDPIERSVGGLRVKKILRSDGDDDLSNDEVKYFEYSRELSGEELSSGVLLSEPRYFHSFYLDTDTRLKHEWYDGLGEWIIQDEENQWYYTYVNCEYWYTNSSAINPIDLAKGSHILYSKVREYYGEQGELGYSEYSFDVSSFPENENLVGGYQLMKSWRNVAPATVRIYDGDGNLLRETIYTYEVKGENRVPGLCGVNPGMEGVLSIHAEGVNDDSLKEAIKKVLIDLAINTAMFAINGVAPVQPWRYIPMAIDVLTASYIGMLAIMNEDFHIVSQENDIEYKESLMGYKYEGEQYNLSRIETRAYDDGNVNLSQYKTVVLTSGTRIGQFDWSHPLYHSSGDNRMGVTTELNTDGSVNRVYRKYNTEYDLSAVESNTEDDLMNALLEMKEQGISTNVIEEIYTIEYNPMLGVEGEFVIGGKLLSFEVKADDIIVQDEVYYLELESPVSMDLFEFSRIENNQFIKNENYQWIMGIDEIDEYRKPLTISDKTGLQNSFLREGYDGSLVAHIYNGSSGDVRYTSFESNDHHGWVIDENSIVENSELDIHVARTGRNSYNLQGGISTMINPGDFILSFWSFGSSSISVGGVDVTDSFVEVVPNIEWKYYEYRLHVDEATELTINVLGSNVLVDELRLHPQDVYMTTYCYNGHKNKLNTVCSVSNHCTYYKYNERGQIRSKWNDSFQLVSRMDHAPQNPDEYGDFSTLVTQKALNPVYIDSQSEMSLTDEGFISTKLFYDGLGRLKQNQCIGCEAQGETILHEVHYNAYGEVNRSYLPYTNGDLNSGEFDENFVENQSAFYQNEPLIGHSLFPYREVKRKNSPYREVEEVGAVGEEWQLGEGHTSKRNITYNGIDEVLFWMPSENNKGAFATENGETRYWPANQLTKVEHTDENGKRVIDFYNIRQQLVCSRYQVNSSQSGSLIYTTDRTNGEATNQGPEPNGTDQRWVNRYLVYDIWGQLIYEVSPAMLNALENSSNGLMFKNYETGENYDIFNGLGTYWEYDVRGRVTAVKMPGVDYSYFIYNVNDQVVLMQDPEMRTTNKWTFTRFDQLGRLVYDGVAIIDESISVIRSSWNAATELYEVRDPDSPIGYSSNLPFSVNIEVLDIYFYDDYNFDYGNIEVDFSSSTNRTRAMSTGVKRRIVGGDLDSYNTSLTTYNVRGHVDKTYETNILGGYDEMSFEYHWSGLLKKVSRMHHLEDGAETIVIENQFNYDRIGRLLEVKQKTGSDPEIVLSRNEFNALGQVVKHHLHIPDGQDIGMQVMDYRYNIRGWIRKINNSNLVDDNDNEEDYDVFGMEILYTANDWLLDEGGNKYNSTASVKPIEQFNGLISAVKWNTKDPTEDGTFLSEKTYVYRYDDAYRMTAGYFAEENQNFGSEFGKFSSKRNFYTEKVDYDVFGGIVKLKRFRPNESNTSAELFDNLVYTYESNSYRLKSVQDLSSSETLEGRTQFEDGADLETEYDYDKNGNITADANKGYEYAYNQLGLVSSLISAENSDVPVTYIYDSSGKLLKKTSGDKSWLYVNGFEYQLDENGNWKLKQIQTSEGVVRPKLESESNPTLYVYDYFLRDHLGNVRAVITEGNATDVVEVATMEDAYVSFEEYIFDNVENSSDTKPVEYPFVTSGDIKVSGLGGSTGIVYGPSRLMKVSGGDKIHVETASWYKEGLEEVSGQTVESVISSMLFALVSQGNGIMPDGEKGYLAFANSESLPSNALSNFVSDEFNENDFGKPQARLFYIVLNKDLVVDARLSGSVLVGNPEELAKLEHDLVMRTDGYFFTFLSNYSRVKVLFDNFTIKHKQGVVRAKFDYYPFGLMWDNPTSVDKYSETYGGSTWSNGEWDNASLELYQFPLRFYDPTLGMFISSDPFAQFDSPYLANYNNPANFMDPSGGYSIHYCEFIENGLNFGNFGSGLTVLGGANSAYNAWQIGSSVNQSMSTSAMELFEGVNAASGVPGGWVLRDGTPVWDPNATPDTPGFLEPFVMHDLGDGHYLYYTPTSFKSDMDVHDMGIAEITDTRPWYKNLSIADIGHTVLDIVGTVPIFGAVADLVNAWWYFEEGNVAYGAMSMLAAAGGSGAIIAIKYGGMAVAKTAIAATTKVAAAKILLRNSDVAAQTLKQVEKEVGGEVAEKGAKEILESETKAGAAVAEEAAKTGGKSVNQLNIAVKRGQAPKGIVRFDKGRGTKNLPQDEVHFLDGSSLYRDGTWRHDNGYKLTNEQIEFLIQNGWSIPK